MTQLAHAAPSGWIWRFVDSGVSRLLRYSAWAGEGRVPAAAVQRSARLQVRRVTVEAEGVRSFELARPDGEALAPWQPGCHLDVTMASGRKRQYSLCGDPRDRSGYRIAVRCLPNGRGGSRELHALGPGASVDVSAPRNAFPFIAAPRYAFLAGGIGITALLPMVRAASEGGAEWTLLYVGRSRASMPFLSELQQLAAAPAATLHVLPDDEQGRPNAERLLGLLPFGAPLYACGPSPLVAALRPHAPSERIPALHDERFTPAAVVGGQPFELELGRSGAVLHVAADETALAALERQRPDVAHSCRQGFCGTCRVRVLAGEVQHRDACLAPTERSGAMMLCVSRAQPGTQRIVIDL